MTALNTGGKGLKKWFGELEVIEAKKGIRIQPNESDIKNAVRNDPMKCVFSKACQRMWSAKTVVFFGTVAYVDLLDKNGVRHVERFMISSAGQKFIKAFDRGQKLSLKGFWLNAPTKSQTAKERTKNSKQTSKARRKAILLGKTIVKGKLRPKRRPSQMRLSTFFRNGMGMAQFPQKLA